jgi:hypothetical protein
MFSQILAAFFSLIETLYGFFSLVSKRTPITITTDPYQPKKLRPEDSKRSLIPVPKPITPTQVVEFIKETLKLNRVAYNFTECTWTCLYITDEQYLTFEICLYEDNTNYYLSVKANATRNNNIEVLGEVINTIKMILTDPLLQARLIIKTPTVDELPIIIKPDEIFNFKPFLETENIDMSNISIVHLLIHKYKSLYAPSIDDSDSPLIKKLVYILLDDEVSIDDLAKQHGIWALFYIVQNKDVTKVLTDTELADLIELLTYYSAFGPYNTITFRVQSVKILKTLFSVPEIALLNAELIKKWSLIDFVKIVISGNFPDSESVNDCLKTL